MEIKRRRGIGLTVVALTLLFCVISTITLAGAASTVVEVVPADQTVAAGESFSVDVWVKDVMYMGADQAVLNFDHDAVQATGIVEGVWLKDCPGGEGTLAIEEIDNTTGTATFLYALMNSSACSRSGDGILATINFDTDPAAAPGKYPLNLTKVKLKDRYGETIPDVSVSNGTVTIISPAPVPGLSGTGMVAVIGVLAIVLAISVGTMRKRRK